MDIRWNGLIINKKVYRYFCNFSILNKSLKREILYSIDFLNIFYRLFLFNKINYKIKIIKKKKIKIKKIKIKIINLYNLIIFNDNIWNLYFWDYKLNVIYIINYLIIKKVLLNFYESSTIFKFKFKNCYFNKSLICINDFDKKYKFNFINSLVNVDLSIFSNYYIFKNLNYKNNLNLNYFYNFKGNIIWYENYWFYNKYLKNDYINLRKDVTRNLSYIINFNNSLLSSVDMYLFWGLENFFLNIYNDFLSSFLDNNVYLVWFFMRLPYWVSYMGFVYCMESDMMPMYRKFNKDYGVLFKNMRDLGFDFYDIVGLKMQLGDWYRKLMASHIFGILDKSDKEKFLRFKVFLKERGYERWFDTRYIDKLTIDSNLIGVLDLGKYRRFLEDFSEFSKREEFFIKKKYI